MSFASEVKKELMSVELTDKCCEKALVMGILHGGSEIVISKDGNYIIVKSYILSAIQKVMQIVKKNYDVNLVIKYGDENNLNKKRYYYLEISNNINPLIREFNLYPFDTLNIKHPLLINDCCKASFIRGLFIARGSINDPRKNCYHLEITCHRSDVAQVAKHILASNQINAKIRERKDNYVLYIKKSEEISAGLAYIGASSGVFYFEDSRIVRDIANMANRMTNCDIANLKKSSVTANKQLKAIKYIRKMGYFNKMPVRLQTISIMREEYPDSTLDELSAFSDNYFGKTLTKSGVSHCLRSLMQFYYELASKNSVTKNQSEKNNE